MDKKNFWDKKLVSAALLASLVKLNPKTQVKNPVMFVTLAGAVMVTAGIIGKLPHVSGFEIQIALWLWFTILFANFAEAMAEGHGKARAESLRKSRVEITARLLADGRETKVPASQLRKGGGYGE